MPHHQRTGGRHSRRPARVLFDMTSGPVYDGAPPVRERVVYKSKQVVKTGVGFGSALAIAISWSVHHSILWAIIHGIFSWVYVIYYALTR